MIQDVVRHSCEALYKRYKVGEGESAQKHTGTEREREDGKEAPESWKAFVSPSFFQLRLFSQKCRHVQGAPGSEGGRARERELVTPIKIDAKEKQGGSYDRCRHTFGCAAVPSAALYTHHARQREREKKRERTCARI